jgi:predicted dehydrogenase
LHAPLALQALAAGCHAVVEKPIALCTADARAMLEAAQRHNRLLFGVMQNRYTPAAQWLKQVVASGQLGRPLLVEINCFWNRDERYYTPGGWKGRLATDGGTLFTQFSHFIDILYWVFGDIEGIAAQVANLTHPHLTDFEDTGTATFRLANGGGLGSLNFTTSVWGRNQESSLTVVAERGSLKIGGQYMNSLEYCHIDGLEPPQLAPTPPPNEYAGYQGSANNHGLLFQHVLQVLGGQAPPATNAFEGYKVVEIIERIYRAAGGNHFAPPGLTQP